MSALEECHARGFLFRLTGGCNDVKTEVNKCLRAARLERTARNRDLSRAKQERVRDKWRGIEEES
ncbi:MAG: hypothetical protein M1837_002216 [Sclerophora amabilis]|nr:MAG: hypothetical protein M1837_002216 [Sclerophora amabilis]